MCLGHWVARGEGRWERRPGGAGILIIIIIIIIISYGVNLTTLLQICWTAGYHLDIFLPVKVGEFTIWGAVRGGVGVTVGHPGLVEPVHILELDLKISFLWKYESVIKVWLF